MREGKFDALDNVGAGCVSRVKDYEHISPTVALTSSSAEAKRLPPMEVRAAAKADGALAPLVPVFLNAARSCEVTRSSTDADASVVAIWAKKGRKGGD